MQQRERFDPKTEALLSYFEEFLRLGDLTQHKLVLPIRYRLNFLLWCKFGKSSLFTKIPAAILVFVFNILPAIPLVILSWFVNFISILLGPLYFLTLPVVLIGTILFAFTKKTHTFCTRAVFGGTESEYQEQIFVSLYPKEVIEKTGITETQIRELYRKLVDEKPPTKL